MILVNESGFAFAWTMSRLRSARTTVTFVAKATFELRPDGLTPAAEQPPPTGDIFLDDDPRRLLLSASELVPFKPWTDLLVTGSCGPSRGVSRVAFSVGAFEKRLWVFGERASLRETPKPFAKIPLTYERSFGGPGFARNPLGIGCGDGRVPNVLGNEDPAGFGPIPPSWPQRTSKAGRVDRAWLAKGWPHVPPDFDWSYFNAAPEDQQLRSYLRGDEPIRFEHLHPVSASRLPGIRIRTFHAPRGEEPREIAMHLDTFAADLDAGRVTLLWRGLAEIAGDEPTGRVLVVSEKLGEPRDPAWPSTSEPEEPEPERPAFAPAEPKSPSRAWCLAQPLLAGRDLTGVDLSKADLAGANLREAILADARLAGANLTGADLSGAILTHADLRGAVLERARLAKADLRDADLREARLAGAVLEEADLTNVTLVDAILDGLRARGVVLAGADLTRARLRGADLEGGDLSRAVLDRAELAMARLVEATLEGAWGPGVAAAEADLTSVRASKCRFAKAALPGVRATESVWDGAVLDGADLAGADFSESSLERARFDGARLSRCSFRSALLPGADLRRAQARRADLFRAILGGADLRDADLSESNLFEADLADCATEGARFDGALLQRTGLHDGR